MGGKKGPDPGCWPPACPHSGLSQGGSAELAPGSPVGSWSMHLGPWQTQGSKGQLWGHSWPWALGAESRCRGTAFGGHAPGILGLGLGSGAKQVWLP